MFTANVIKVMIASPGDVPEERRIIRETIYKWNELHAEKAGIALLPVAWETHSWPRMGDRPQGVINKQVLESADLLIGAFGTRLGTPTGEAPSGTVEEIGRHIALGKPAMIYFSDAPMPRDNFDVEQFNALAVFRKECAKKGRVATYDSIEAFRGDFERHLTQEIGDSWKGVKCDDRELVALAPPEQQPRIRFQARGLTNIQYDHSAKMYTHLYDGSGHGFSIVIQILNLAVRGTANRPVRVRAQAMYKRSDETTLLSPLVWLDSPTSDVVIGPGEIRELVIARRDAYNFWDFLTHGHHGNITPSDGIDFDLEIDLIDLDSGNILSVTPSLYFHWHWREGPLTPHFYPVSPHKGLKEDGRQNADCV